MEPFKEQLNLKNVTILANSIKEYFAEFKRNQFLKKIAPLLVNKELKARVQTITMTLLEFLPKNPRKTFPIIIRASKKIPGFKSWPLVEIVGYIGMQDIHLSLKTLLIMTEQFSAEFTLRSFLLQHEKITLQFLHDNLYHSSHHVRRLISEGTRPLLPWGQQLQRFKENPSLTWDFLEVLKDDPSEYVRKSVANHINDHSKNHKEWLLKKLSLWKVSQHSPLDKILRHGLRTLIKKGDQSALRLIGISANSVHINFQKISPPNIYLGNNLSLSFIVHNCSTKKIQVIMDYKVLLLRANGSYSEKVFKGKNIVLNPLEIRKMTLGLKLKKVTTRKYYSGKHYICLIVNGQESRKKIFTLNV